MATNKRNTNSVAYGLNNALQRLAPQPIVSERNPTVRDSAQIATLWCNTASNTCWALTSVVAGSATWTQLS